ncbi:MAG: hypothetical protein ACOCR6_00690 [archaeon]
MAHFTFVELHLEEGAIPQPGILGGSDTGSEDTDGGTGGETSGGSGRGAFLFVLLTIVVAIALARKRRKKTDRGIEEL